MMTSMTMTSSTISNSKASLPDHIHIFKVYDHDHYKPRLLESIQTMIDDNNIQLNEKGYYYDFNLPNAPRTYRSLMDQLLYPYISEMCEIYGLVHENNTAYWFQQYLQSSDFGWHQHNGHWACVYYLELPEMSEVTEFLNYGQFDISEGDVIFFPSFLVHRSPIIKSNLRKTIIATNTEFRVDREMIQLYGKEHFKY